VVPLDWFSAPGYWIGRLVLQELLALVYLIAFVAAARQFRPLLGCHGLTPIPRLLRASGFARAPSVFHAHYSDRFFLAVTWLGILDSVAMLGRAEDIVPLWAAMLLWALPWALYLSIVNVGGIWYGFGWESLLLEAGFLAIFLGPSWLAPPRFVLWLFCWLLFRVEFGAGLIKIRHDPCWRDLTCTRYHHETQPMPGPASWYFHHLPDFSHRTEVLSNHAAQLLAPFALFAPQPASGVAAYVVIVTQLWLMASGNFAWLNLVTLTLAFAALDDTLLPVAPPGALAAPPSWFQGVVLALLALVVALSYGPVRNMVGRGQVMNRSFSGLRLVNSYGAFGDVTRQRDEVVLEGTLKERPDGQGDWREYEIPGKPGDPSHRPPQVAPYHLRLAWLMWFAALSPAYARSWLPPLAEKLLHGDPLARRLLRVDPFGGEAPVQVRARLYRYRFTTPEERRATGDWWVRRPVGTYLEPMRRGESRRSPAG
jgi:hypothetical protein